MALSRLNLLLVAGLVCLVIILGWQVLVLRAERLAWRDAQELAGLSTQLMDAKLSVRTTVGERMINELAQELRQAENWHGVLAGGFYPTLSNLSGVSGAWCWRASRGSGCVILKGLPQLADGLVYQVWLQAAVETTRAGSLTLALTDGSARLDWSWLKSSAPDVVITVERVEAKTTLPGGLVVLRSR